MLDNLNCDLLLSIFGYCTPEDVLELSLVSKRLNSFVCDYQRHLPRFLTNCAVKLTNEHRIKIRLWPCKDSFGNSNTNSTKQIIYMPRMNPNNSMLIENLSRYKITNLSLYGTGDRKVEISRMFIEWLTKEMQPVVEFISLKDLNLCDLDNFVWTRLLALCSSNCKFSSINCTYPRSSMIYQVYERVPMFEYLTETYSTTIENDLPIESVEQRNLSIFQRLINGNPSAMDLSSMSNLTIGSILEFISSWIHSKSPNDFTYLCLWKTFESSRLERQLIEHENGRLINGNLIEFQNLMNSNLRLFVDTQQRLFLNMCVKNVNGIL